jgi:8-oxo-dGTP pyrophosphatase MutT (NUDIX family)
MKKDNAGTLLICRPKNTFLLVQRGNGNYKGKWSTVGGKMEEGEVELETAKRELNEETQIDPNKVEFHYFESKIFMGKKFTLFLGFCDEEFECVLDEENDDYGWFGIDNLPKDLYPTLYTTLLKIF